MRLNFSSRPDVVAGGLLLQGLQVFAEQVEARRDAEIDHDHVGGLCQVVADGNRVGGDVVLRQLRAVVGHVDRQRFGRRLLLPRSEVAADDLVRETASAFELELHVVGAVAQSMPLRTNWWSRSLFSGVSLSVSTGLPLSVTATEPRTSEALHCEASKQRAQCHDRGLRGAPGAGGVLLGRDEVEGLANDLGSLSPLEQRLGGEPRGLDRWRFAPVE